MKIVGEKLERAAQSEKDILTKDLFGRSAFNRYYYAAFLITREMLGELNLSWKTTPHKEIPNLLTTGVKKPVLKRLKMDARKDLITEGEKSTLITKLTSATTNLSNLLGEAYDIRVIADYEPEIPIEGENNKLVLKNHKLTTANGWANRASAYCKDIRSVWRDSGLV
jgi:hypothetical protein